MNKGISTILFMVTITAVFIAALAIVNAVSLPKIQMNAQIQQLKSILYAFDLLPEDMNDSEVAPSATTSDLPWNESAMMDIQKKMIHTFSIPVPDSLEPLLEKSYLSVGDSVKIWALFDNTNQIVAYGFPIKGKGLWGTITAFAVVSPDLRTMIGIDFTEQVETPGLGARIMEQEFKYFFRNLDLSKFRTVSASQSPIVMLRNKAVPNVVKSTNEVEAITGATLTSDGVLNMVNTDLRFYLSLLAGVDSLSIGGAG